MPLSYERIPSLTRNRAYHLTKRWKELATAQNPEPVNHFSKSSVIAISDQRQNAVIFRLYNSNFHTQLYSSTYLLIHLPDPPSLPHS